MAEGLSRIRRDDWAIWLPMLIEYFVSNNSDIVASMLCFKR